MNLSGLTLAELGAVIYGCLRNAGVEAIVVGGSAITIHVPAVYTSNDIDLALISGFNRNKVVKALEGLGFRESGRDFAHPETPYTIDLVAETPYVDRRPILEFCTVETSAGPVRTYYIEDAIADRIAAWVHWSDSQSLRVAERALTASKDTIRTDRLSAAIGAIESGDPRSSQRLELARGRISKIARSMH
jgi:hypothetical protein